MARPVSEETFAAIKAAKPTPELLAYQYLQQLPEMAKGEGSKVWVVPSVQDEETPAKTAGTSGS